MNIEPGTLLYGRTVVSSYICMSLSTYDKKIFTLFDINGVLMFDTVPEAAFGNTANWCYT